MNAEHMAEHSRQPSRARGREDETRSTVYQRSWDMAKSLDVDPEYVIVIYPAQLNFLKTAKAKP